jgi:hypothetical protein
MWLVKKENRGSKVSVVEGLNIFGTKG